MAVQQQNQHSASIIKVREMHKYFGPLHVIQGVDLDVAPGEVVVIIGPSGGGKSTFLRCLNFLEQPSDGTIEIDGVEIKARAPSREHRRHTREIRQKAGMVFQQFNLINKFTVLENVLLPVRYSKIKLPFDPKKRAEELLHKFGIWERRNFFPNKISGGQQQRTAIVRALIMNPKIILADEPTGNVDSKTGKEILDILERLNTEFGATVIVVTHDQHVSKRTKRHIYMKDGGLTKKYLW